MQGLSTRQTKRQAGSLAIVLHTHMPYVEGFGTWPFGEEWLWEAIATSYLPLLSLLERDAPLTLSLTPVLCDQLEVRGLGARFERFVTEVRRATHLEDAAGLRKGGYGQLADELDRSLLEYEQAALQFASRGGDLLAAFAPYAQWTSSATHAVLPLLATQAGVKVQAKVGIDAHRRRFGESFQGGFWLPECGYSPGLEAPLIEAGARVCCIESTGALGLGAPEHLRPRIGPSGLTLLPIDRETISLVWSEMGYPAHPHYRDYHRHTIHHHNPWSNGGEPYDAAKAKSLARRHAAGFVTAVKQRLAGASQGATKPLRGGGLVVCALDTELLGHWWYEGITWLEGVVEECARQGLRLLRIGDALELHEPLAGEPGGDRFASGHSAGDRFAGADPEDSTTWGSGGGLATWSGPAVAELAFAQRAAELRLRAAGERASATALRQLLALQASDWAFMVSRQLAAPYAHERFAGHVEAFELALADGAKADPAPLRNLAPWARAPLAKSLI